MDSGSSSDSDHEVASFKIVLLGNGSVGKTTLIQSFCQNFNSSLTSACHSTTSRDRCSASNRTTTAGVGNGGSYDASGNWRGQYKQTVGADFYTKAIKLPSCFRQSSPHGDGEGSVVLHLWDVGGQQIGGAALPNYLYDADAICLVYDVTNVNSFKSVEDWYNCVKGELLSTNANCSVNDIPNTRSDDISPSAGSDTPPSGVTPVTSNLNVSCNGSERSTTATTTTTTPYSQKDHHSNNNKSNTNTSINSATVTQGDDGGVATALSSVIRSSSRRQRGQGREGRGQPMIVLVGTKTDAAVGSHAVSPKAHERFVASNALDGSFFVSSRTGDHVCALFLKLTADLLGLDVRQQDLADFGRAATTVDSATVAEPGGPATQLFSREGQENPARFRSGKDISLSAGQRPDDCVVM